MKRKNWAAIIIIILSIAGYFGYSYVSDLLEPTGIKVGILDTGLEFPSEKDVHQSFVKKEYGYSADEEPYDVLGHGTSIVNILRNKIGDIKIQIYSGRIVSTDGFITSAGIEAGLKWLLESDVRLVMLSFGSQPLESSNLRGIEQVIEQLVFNNIYVIAAVGNSANPNYMSYDSGEFPAIHPDVIGVGATNRTDQHAPYSSFGTSYYGSQAVDVVADGVNHRGDGIGTSFAVPRVAATVIQIYDYLKNTYNVKLSQEGMAVMLASSTNQEYTSQMGFGIPDFEQAILNFESNRTIYKFYTDPLDQIGERATRFYNEEFTFRVFFKSFEPVSEPDELYFSGTYNGSGLVYIDTELIKEGYSEGIEYTVRVVNTNATEIYSELNILTRVLHGGFPVAEFTTSHSFQYEYNKTFSYDTDNINYMRVHQYGKFRQMDQLLRDQFVLPIYELDWDADFIYRPHQVRTDYGDVYQYVSNGGTYIESYDLISNMFTIDSFLFDNEGIIPVDFGDVSVRSTVHHDHSLTEGIDVMYHEGIGFRVDNENVTILSTMTGEDVILSFVQEYGNGNFVFLGSSRYLSNYGYWKSDQQSIIVNLVDSFS